MATKTSYEHIVLNEKNIPVISSTRMRVIDIVMSQTAYGWSSEELQFQFPNFTLGEIHSALAYYWDHKEELDKDIENRLIEVDNFHK